MKKSGEIQKRPEGPESAKYESRSVSFKQEQKKKKNAAWDQSWDSSKEN